MTQKLGDYGNDMKICALWGLQPLRLEPPQCTNAVLTYAVLQTVS
ncbi:hypothetical protein BIFCAT_00443 [Bifidobacterium catenulatum DSM 16992 = JCM 1194 = LMG 11043]|uniref:Uncharacterized protein n=1 Tax=Bifidobacterium catenulatum DSM 16992 = JCM 1194 = LMG 11043 TaxID=566552 RepID=B6XUM9_9BIFI|nr:hypothetical protein BIFCAT_00443 [Bifidobacterium catenulatum DSM 16992 = JCM 1194 = LMG 11043]